MGIEDRHVMIVDRDIKHELRTSEDRGLRIVRSSGSHFLLWQCCLASFDREDLKDTERNEPVDVPARGKAASETGTVTSCGGIVRVRDGHEAEPTSKCLDIRREGP